MAVMTISEARAALPEVVSRVAEGEEVTITRHGLAAAVVVRPDIIWSQSGSAVITADIAELAAELGERARRQGRTLEEELRMILQAAHQAEQPQLPPLSLHTVHVGGTSTWSREEIYGDDGR
jgi:antitoxin (DNA-binding transcriptional repressor) of toxin-antitoxin stability system